MTQRADILLYVQHLLGIGHLSRAALIAKALDRAGLEVLFVSGGMPLPNLDIGGAELAQLPPLRTADSDFSGLVDGAGQPIDEAWRNARRDRLLALFEAARPRALVTEMFPFGRRQLRFELMPLLEAARARAPRPQVFCSLRDVLNPQAKPEKTAWILDTVARYYDRVLVHGDPAFVTLEQSFPEAVKIADKLIYTGYVVGPPPADVPAEGDGKDEVLVSTGGGAVAGPLIDVALAARPLTTLKDHRWRILVGHNLPDEQFHAYRKAAPAGVVVERARPDFLALLARCKLSISQAGYNTVMEVLAAGPAAVVVPFAAGAEREQSLRAGLLAERGLLSVAEEAGLDGPALARAIEAALERGPTAGAALAMDGAAETGNKLVQLLARIRR